MSGTRNKEYVIYYDWLTPIGIRVDYGVFLAFNEIISANLSALVHQKLK